MGIQVTGQGGSLLQIDAAHRAARMSLRPADVGSLGGYRLTMFSGSIAATLAAAAPLFSMRWSDATRFMVLHELAVLAVINGTITTAIPVILEAVLARSFTVSDSGGTAATLTGNNAKNRTSPFGTTLVGDARMATTAALTAGTRTLDTQGFGMAAFHSGTTQGASPTPLPMTPIYKPQIGQEYPIVLAQNEGFILRNVNTGPATGTFIIGVMVAWSEMTAFSDAPL